MFAESNASGCLENSWEMKVIAQPIKWLENNDCKQKLIISHIKLGWCTNLYIAKTYFRIFVLKQIKFTEKPDVSFLGQYLNLPNVQTTVYKWQTFFYLS